MAKKMKRLPRIKEDAVQETYLLKLPVFIIPLKKEDKGLFGAMDKLTMVENLKTQLEKFPKTELSNRGKLKKTQIESLALSTIYLDEHTPCLLVQAAVSDSNLEDTYLSGPNQPKSKIPKTSVISGEKYFILFYPRIEGIDSNQYTYTWLQVIYEDPTHETGIATKVAKKIAKSIINVESFNVKLQSAIEDFKKIKLFPEVQIELTSVDVAPANEFSKYETYLVDSKESRHLCYNFKNMPHDIVEEIFRDTDSHGFITTKAKAIIAKKEYRVKREHYQDHADLKSTFEQLYNFSYEVTKEEIDSGELFKEEFLMARFSSVIEAYLLNQ